MNPARKPVSEPPPESSKRRAETSSSSKQSSVTATTNDDSSSAFRATQALATAGVPSKRSSRRLVTRRKTLALRQLTSFSSPPNDANEQLPVGRYAVFECRWEACRAKLHNLDTLRKHVRKVHVRRSNISGGGGSSSLECRWNGCEKAIRAPDPRIGREDSKTKRHSFSDVDKCESHVEQLHIWPMSWVKGDGPTAGLLGEFTN